MVTLYLIAVRYTYMIPHAHYQMLLHLLATQTKPARSPGNRGPLGGRRLLPSFLLLLTLLTSSQRPRVEEEVLLRKGLLTISLKGRAISVACKETINDKWKWISSFIIHNKLHRSQV